MTASLIAPVVGFSYLEPKRHIPHITDLNGLEAASLGSVLARVTRILLEETGAELIYVNWRGIVGAGSIPPATLSGVRRPTPQTTNDADGAGPRQSR